MKWLGDKPFHTLLLLTEKPGAWAPWLLVPISLASAAGGGLAWAAAVGEQAWGWAVALGLLVWALADWSFLALLPRRRVSFGPIQPPFLALTLLRGLVSLSAVLPATRWPLTALIALVLVQIALSALMAHGTLVEPFRLRVTSIQVRLDKLSNPGSKLHIIQLSDLHVERITRRERMLPALVAGLAPDLLVLTGDFLSTSYNDDPGALADLRTVLAQLYAPLGIYAIWGTAEVDLPHLLRPVLQELGIVTLEDEAVEVPFGDHCLWLVGLSCSRDLTADGNRLRALLAQAPPDAVSLLLYHTPDLMPQAAACGVDLYLAGHTHGGQWCLPGLGAILTSSRYWKRYEGGHYHEGNTHLYVSRGLGMEGFGAPRARFFCPPEVVTVTLSGAGQVE